MLQIAELGAGRLGGDGQDAEPVPLVHDVVKLAGGVVAGRAIRLARGFLLGHRAYSRSDRRCAANAIPPAASSTSAGKSTPGSVVYRHCDGVGFQPRLNTMFSALYSSASSAAPVKSAATTARPGDRSAFASTHSTKAMISIGNVPRTVKMPSRTSIRMPPTEMKGSTSSAAVMTRPASKNPRDGVRRPTLA